MYTLVEIKFLLIRKGDLNNLGVYDILVLPPSFAFGGMENPCLTFTTPSLLAGDRFLTSVVAHEISHSWSGNLVAIGNFEHFWLKEGLTVFLQYKIDGRMSGEKVRHFYALMGLSELKDAVSLNLILCTTI